MREAAVGSLAPETVAGMRSGLENNRTIAHLLSVASALEESFAAPEKCAVMAHRLRRLAANLNQEATQGEAAMPNLEALENSLTSFENELFTALKVATPPEIVEQLSEKATRQAAAFKDRLNAVRLREVERQFVQKQLLSHFNLPRLSLFYMHQG